MTDAAPGPYDVLRSVLAPGVPLRASAKLLLLALYQHSDSGTGANSFASVKRLASCCSLSRQTVISALRELKALGILTATPRPGGATTYSVSLRPLVEWSKTRTGQKQAPVSSFDRTGARFIPPPVKSKHSTVLLSTEPLYLAKRSARTGGRPSAQPAVEEVAAYLAELGETRFTAEEFCDYYEARGWRLKSGPVKDWRACVRTWRRNQNERSAPRAQQPRTAPEVQSVTAVQPGRCAECGQRSALTLCEACQAEHLGEVALTEKAFIAGQGRRG